MTGQDPALLFELGGRLHALAAACVHGVVAPPAVVACPFAPPAVEGLVALGGRIMPLVDLEALLAGYAARPQGDGSGQVIEMESGSGRLALRVGRVLALVPADTPVWEGRAVSHLVAAEIVLGFASGVSGPAIDDDGSERGKESVPAGEPEGRGEACVVVSLGAARYALPVRSVQEIAPLGEVWPIPEAPSAVRGLAYLRGMPLPVVSLASLLGQPLAEGGVLVVLAKDGGRLVLAVDGVIGVRRLTRIDGGEEVHLGEEGAVAVLLDPALLIPDAIARRFRSWTASMAPAAAVAATRSLVTFMASGESCALPLDEVERAVDYRAPAGLPSNRGRLTAAIEVGGDVVPVIDLRARLRPGAEAGSPGACLAIRIGGNAYALAIDRLDRLASVPEADIEAVAGEDGPVVGVGRLGGRPLWLLSARRLIEAAEVGVA